MTQELPDTIETFPLLRNPNEEPAIHERVTAVVMKVV